MNPTVFLALFLVLAAALFAFGAAMLSPKSPFRARIQALLGRKVQRQTQPNLEEKLGRVLEPISKAIPQSPEEVSATRALLMQAGYRDKKHLTVYMSFRVLMPLMALGCLAVTGLLWRSTLLAFVLTALAWVIPSFFLKRMITARQKLLRLSLPDALDLAVICVEAGLGLDQTIARVCTEMTHVHPELSDELSLVTLEMRAGKPRPEALRNFANRTGVDDIRALVTVLIQTDRFGTSIATALRVHSDALRTERRQRAEEQAAKTTIKMVPVLVFFVFPAMFIVTLGPAVIRALREVVPALNQ